MLSSPRQLFHAGLTPSLLASRRPLRVRQLLYLGSHPRGRVSRLEGSGVRPQDRTASPHCLLISLISPIPPSDLAD
ncbi:hypothetical protein [Tolypothrix sp. VBCCA 56010]|uniref:hypothetical protein n=1 Tax=Tolypothrix sp. VBCCA 56010 TaxID=3137731 RepID=UPI003D7C4611